MSYSDTVATLSFLISCVAFGIPYWNQRKAKKKERCTEFLELFTRTKWTNEGYTSEKPKNCYILEIHKAGGLSNVYGALHVNNAGKYYDFYGYIDTNGLLRTTLNMPLLEGGASIARVQLAYSEDVGQIVYYFDGFINSGQMANQHKALDTTQILRRIEESS